MNRCLAWLLTVLLSCFGWSIFAQPTNDHFTNATALLGLPAFGIGDNTGATREPGEPYTTTGNQSVWWRWTSPVSGRVEMQSTGPWGYWLYVSAGNALADLQPIFGTPDPVRVFEVQAGGVYYISVGNIAYSTNGPISFSIWPLPPNDRLETADELTGLHPVAAITNGHGDQLWWKWDPPASCHVRIGVSGEPGQYGIRLGRFAGGTNFQWIAQDFLKPLVTKVESGSTYYIFVNPNRRTNTLNARLEVITYPQSDSFTGAIELVGNDVFVLADSASATSEPGEPRHFPLASGRTLWWRWRAPAEGEVTVVGAPAIGYPTIYRGDSVKTLQRLAPAAGVAELMARTAVQSNEMLYLVSDGTQGGGGDFGLHLQFQAKPRNDDFENRTAVLTGNETFMVDFGTATRQRGEPKLWGDGNHTVWWKFTASVYGTLKVSADDLEGQAPMEVGVYRGKSLRTLRAAPDGSGVAGFDVQPGIEYQILISPTRYVRLGKVEFQFVPAPPNDNFAGRLFLQGRSLKITNTTESATIERGERPVAGAGKRTVWYSWTSPGDGFLWLSARTMHHSCLVTMFEGTKVSKLRAVANSLPVGWPEQGAFGARVTGGRNYAIVVNTSAGDSGGIFELKLDFSQVELASPDDSAEFQQHAPIVFSINASSAPAIMATTYQVTDLFGVSTNFSSTGMNSPVTISNLPPGLAYVYGTAVDEEGAKCRTTPAVILIRPEGDAFGVPLEMSGYGWSRTFSLDGAGVEKREPAVKGGSRVPGSVWVRWTAPATGTARVAVQASELVQLSVFTGRLGLLHPVRLKRSVEDWTYTFSTRAGTVYRLRVAAPVPQGSVTFTLELPSATMISPHHNSLYAEFAPVPLNVAITEPLTNIAAFSYVDGTNMIVSAAGPFAFAWSNAAPGAHAVSCRILTRTGLTITSKPVVINVSPGNDFFTNRFQLTGLLATVPCNFHAATTETGEPQHGGLVNDRTIWWTWTSPASGRVRIRYTNWTVRPLIAVYSGGSVSSLTPVAANGGWWRLWPGESFDFDTVSGVTYQIAAAANQQGAAEIDLKMLLTPANDAFANRVLVDGTNSAIAGTTLLTSLEPNEPAMPPGYGYVGRSIWYSWKAPTNGSVLIDAHLIGCRLGVFAGTELTNLVPVPVAASYYGGNMVLVEVTNGQAIEIAFDTGLNEVENFSAQLTFNPAPANDDFVNALPLSGTDVLFIADVVGAGLEPGEPAHFNWFGPRSVWFTWTAPVSGAFQADTDPVATLNIYTGEALESLLPVSSTLNPQRFTVTAGVTYHIAVGPPEKWPGYFIYQGPMTIRIAPQ